MCVCARARADILEVEAEEKEQVRSIVQEFNLMADTDRISVRYTPPHTHIRIPFYPLLRLSACSLACSLAVAKTHTRMRAEKEKRKNSHLFSSIHAPSDNAAINL